MMTRYTPSRLFAAAVWLVLSLGTAGTTLAEEAAEKQEQPSATPGVEVNMEALESLSPSREKQDEEPPAPEAGAPPLSPPTSQPAEGGPPALEHPEHDEGDGPPPAAQSPEAPMMQEGQTLPSGKSALAGSQIIVLFDAGEARLSLNASNLLDETAARVLDQPVRLQLFAYAGEKGDSPSSTRRLALERAIAIRGYLMDRGIDGTRIDLRPQGPVAEAEDADGPPERVDIRFIQQ